MTYSEPIVLPPDASNILEHLLELADSVPNPDSMTRVDIIGIALHLYLLALTDAFIEQPLLISWSVAYILWQERDKHEEGKKP